MLAERAAPIVSRSGRVRLGLSEGEYMALRTSFVRLFAWLESGRQIDPWQSGYGGTAIRYDRPHAKHHKPSGGFGPGVAALDDGPDAELLRAEEYYRSRQPYEQQLLVWRFRAGATHAACAGRLGLTERETARQWSRIIREAYEALYGAR